MLKAVELNCGIMAYNRETNLVKADKRQGKLKAHMNYEGEKILIWTAKGESKPEVEIYLFPKDAVFRPVKGTKGGRVFYLSFNSFDDKYFFWFQEPDVSKDMDIVTSIQRIIDWDEEQEAKLKAAQPKVNTNVTNASKAGVPTGMNPISSLLGLQSQLGGAARPANPSAGFGNLGNVPVPPKPLQHLYTGKRTGPSLGQILTPEYLRTIAQNKEISAELLKLLPENQQNEGFFRENLLSPQFQQALESLDSALMSSEGKSVLQSIHMLDESIFSNATDPIDALLKFLAKNFPKK